MNLAPVLNNQRAPRIGVYALPFGFGPSSKAAAIIDALHSSATPVDITFLSSGVGLELIQRSDIPVTLVDTGDVYGAQASGLALCGDLDAMIVVMHRGLASSAARHLPVFCVDSLAHMWNENSFHEYPGIHDIICYFVQDLFSGAEQMRRAGVPRVVPVPPIVQTIVSPPRRDRQGSIITLGGLESPFAHDKSTYIDNVVSLANSAFDEPTFVLTSDAARSRWGHCFGSTPVMSLSRQDTLRAFAGTSHVFASPGLTTILEMAALGRMPYALPPENYSQLLNLRLVLEHHGDGLGADWRVIDREYHHISGSLEESEGLSAVHHANQSVLRSEDFRTSLLSVWQRQDDPQPPASLVSPLSGAESIAQEVLRFLNYP